MKVIDTCCEEAVAGEREKIRAELEPLVEGDYISLIGNLEISKQEVCIARLYRDKIVKRLSLVLGEKPDDNVAPMAADVIHNFLGRRSTVDERLVRDKNPPSMSSGSQTGGK